MNRSGSSEDEQGWCRSNWWKVGIVVGLIGLSFVSANLLGLIGNSSTVKSDRTLSAGTTILTTSNTNNDGKVGSSLIENKKEVQGTTTATSPQSTSLSTSSTPAGITTATSPQSTSSSTSSTPAGTTANTFNTQSSSIYTNQTQPSVLSNINSTSSFFNYTQPSILSSSFNNSLYASSYPVVSNTLNQTSPFLLTSFINLT